MTAGVYLTSLTTPGSAITQNITGIPFKPAGIITSVGNADGTTTDALGGLGAANASSRQMAGGYRSEDGAGTSDTGHVFRTNRAGSGMSVTTDTVVSEFTYDSANADGFTITWNTVTSAYGYRVMAFSRSMSIGVGTFDLNTATGAQTITGIVDADGNSFTGKLALFYTTLADTTTGTGATARNMFGAATSSTNRACSAGVDTDALGTTDAARYLASNKCIALVSTAAVTAAADFTSFASGQMTIDVTTAPAAAITIGYIVLGNGLGSMSAQVGTFQARTTVGTKSETGVSFQPNFLMTGLPGVVALDTLETFMTAGFGTTDGLTQFADCSNSQDNAGTSNADRGGRATQLVISSPASAAALVIEGAWQAWTADGFTVDWTVVTGSAVYYMYIAMSVPDAPEVDLSSGDTLCWFTPQMNEAPSSNYATLDLRNGHLVLDFDDTTQETAIFSAIMPRAYAGNGVTVYIHWGCTSAIVGTGGWDVSFEQISDSAQDIDSDGFATAQTVTAATVPGTSGNIKITSVAITDGANMDSVSAGEGFRIRVRRNVAADTAVGDLELWGVEIKET